MSQTKNQLKVTCQLLKVIIRPFNVGINFGMYKKVLEP